MQSVTCNIQLTVDFCCGLNFQGLANVLQQRGCGKNFKSLVKLFMVCSPYFNICTVQLSMFLLCNDVLKICSETIMVFYLLISARVVTDRVSGYSKGFGFVQYATIEDAAKGIEGMDGKVRFIIPAPLWEPWEVYLFLSWICLFIFIFMQNKNSI